MPVLRLGFTLRFHLLLEIELLLQQLLLKRELLIKHALLEELLLFLKPSLENETQPYGGPTSGDTTEHRGTSAGKKRRNIEWHIFLSPNSEIHQHSVLGLQLENSGGRPHPVGLFTQALRRKGLPTGVLFDLRKTLETAGFTAGQRNGGPDAGKNHVRMPVDRR